MGYRHKITAQADSRMMFLHAKKRDATRSWLGEDKKVAERSARQIGIFLLAFVLVQIASGAEQVLTSAVTASGDQVPYLLNRADAGTPRYVLILFPGGSGIVNPRYEDGVLRYQMADNFLLRARKFIVDSEFATVAMDSTHSEGRIQAVIDDVRRRMAGSRIYLVGTSTGTADTMRLAGYLSDKIDGEIHVSALSSIASFDGPSYRNRQLLVHHRNDGCRLTPFEAAETSHSRYGTELIVMDGGASFGNPCKAFGHHGFNGIERETVDAIKHWVKEGK